MATPAGLVPEEEVWQAVRRLQGVIRPTPAAWSSALSNVVGTKVYAKPEHFQRTGSFKIRGAYNKVAALKQQGHTSEVVAASAGNHAQGVALAATLVGLRSVVFMPEGASLPKVEATRRYGAEVRFSAGSVDDAIAAAKAYASRTGACYVPPFDDELVIAGQATVGTELAAELPEHCCVLVPVGGGGLLAGVALGLRAAGSQARVVGVEASGSAPMVAALQAGVPVALEAVDTMADGIAVRCVSELTLNHARELVDSVVTVDEEHISQAVLLLLERCKWVVEPAGAVGLAALLAGAGDLGEPPAVVLSGGNVDPLLLTRLIEHGLSAAGRYLIVRVVLPDKPGSLAGLAKAVSELGLNLLTVEHRRSGVPVGVNEVEVVLTMETRDPSHRDAVVPALRLRGFRAEA
jgi:threonine dehydratase